MKLYEYHEWLAYHETMPTARQVQVLQLLADGKSYGEAARELGISYYTVKNHVHSAIEKMRAANANQAIAEGFRRGLLK